MHSVQRRTRWQSLRRWGNSMKIFVTTQFEGLHRWKDAPEEVGFLREYHRHMFHVRFEVEVTEEDRELEFILVKRELNRLLKNYERASFDLSCESLAKLIVDFMTRKGAICEGRDCSCEISEDGENGAIVGITKEGQFV